MGIRAVIYCVAVALVGCGVQDGLRPLDASWALEQSRLDFGEVPVGVRKELNVKLRNTGYMPFRLLDAFPRDAEPSFEVKLEPSEKVAPGETRDVTLVFHPLREGPLADAVTLTTDAPPSALDTVALEGLGTPTPVIFEPAVVDFETLEVDSQRELTVRVRNPVDLPLTLSVNGPEASEFEATSVTVPPHGVIEVPARFFPRALGARKARLEARSCHSCTAAQAPMQGRSVESALVFFPSPVPFEPVPIHQRTESRTQVRNITWRPVSLGQAVSNEPAFAPLRQLEGTVLASGAAVELPLQFAARGPGPRLAELSVRYTSDREGAGRVQLDATGGRPQLALTPISIDFGELPEGGKRERWVRLTNAGTTGDLHLRGIRGTGATGQFGIGTPRRGRAPLAWSGGAWPGGVTAADLPIAPGADFIEVPVYFEPRALGGFEARLVVTTDDPFYPEREVVLTGSARASGPCNYLLEPWPALDFGNVPVGQGAVLGFRFSNPGRAECAVKDIQLSQDAGGAFFMPGGALVGGVLGSGDAFSAQIAFRARSGGSFQGELVMTVNNPTQPTVRLPLSAVAVDSCLVAAPPFLDFGAVRYDCSAPVRRTFVSNACDRPIVITSAELGQGTSTEFSLLPLPGLPRTLAPYEGFEISASFARTVLGQHYTPLFIGVQGESTRRMVPVLGETNHEGFERDVFVQGTDSQLDVLFVVSNTSTMSGHQARLASALSGFFERANAVGVQLRVGVTSTGLVSRGSCPGGAGGGEAGRLTPVNGSAPRWVDASSPGAAASAAGNVRVGDCHYLVQGLEAVRLALTPPLSDRSDDPRTPLPSDGNLGFVRPAAQLDVVVLADEDDRSGFDPVGYAQLIDSLKGPGATHRTRLHAWVPTDPSCPTAGVDAPRFSEVARLTGGTVQNVCTGDFGRLLDPLLITAQGPQNRFQLTARPDVASGMQVTAGGEAVPEGEGFTYDAAENAIVLHGPYVPQAGQQIAVSYRSQCR